ncbi:hypothetical protein M7I_3019 [Glarea lozoyensis 74030]|uniref:Uncharacterized protein n=1 Tax=Glarea lozoyensis (strain ATCC 74030 / MF5533) TaxID=1104152 RepID=H0EKC3_GLAL7|nr:hypothetical protein M7I_3019 [Glarea lozoyensis 74030]
MPNSPQSVVLVHQAKARRVFLIASSSLSLEAANLFDPTQPKISPSAQSIMPRPKATLTSGRNSIHNRGAITKFKPKPKAKPTRKPPPAPPQPDHHLDAIVAAGPEF